MFLNVSGLNNLYLTRWNCYGNVLILLEWVIIIIAIRIFLPLFISVLIVCVSAMFVCVFVCVRVSACIF